MARGGRGEGYIYRRLLRDQNFYDRGRRTRPRFIRPPE